MLKKLFQMFDIKILCIGDPHIKESSIVETEILIDKVLDAIYKHCPDIIVIMGDVLHNHEKINCVMQVHAIKFFEKVLSSMSQSSRLYVLIGNHDIYNPHMFLTEFHAFYSLKDKDSRMKIVDKPIIDRFGSYNFLFVPFVPAGRFLEACESCVPIDQISSSVSAIFCHQEFTGAMLDNRVSDVERYPSNFPLCVAGHIHKYHIVSDNLIYVGTPYQHRFGEDTDKALLLLGFNEDQILMDRIRIDKIPLKKDLVLSKEEFENLELQDDFNKYKIEIYGCEGEIKSLKLSEKYSKLKGLKNVKLSFTIQSERKSRSLDNQTSSSFKERLEDFLLKENDALKLDFHRFISKKI